MKTRPCVLVIAVLVLLQTTAMSQEDNQAYLRELPAVDQVMKDMKVDDPHMSDARQAAALELLAAFVREMAGARADRNELTADETRLIESYRAGYYKILEANSEGLGQKIGFLGLTTRTGNSAKFQNDLLKKYFSAETLASYAKLSAENHARQKAAAEAQQNAGSTTRPGLDPPYLSEMPSVQRVLDDMRVDGDPDRTAARQANALDTLRSVVTEIARARGEGIQLTNDESRVCLQYFTARQEIVMSSPSAQAAFLKMKNDSANQIHDEVFERYLSADFRAAYDKATAADKN